MPWALVALVAAPITQVTVYADRARIVRTAALAPVASHEKIEFPLLPDTVDPATIRVEATGAEIERVDIERVGATDFPQARARELLAALDALDDELARARGRRAAYAAPLGVLEGLAPKAPDERDRAGRPAPPLDSGSWAAALAFVRAYGDRVQSRLRELDRALGDLDRKRQALVAQANLLGGAKRQSGHRVVAFLAGHGAAALRVAYVVGGATWQPVYELHLDAKSEKLDVRLFGLVSQKSGEDWADAELALSTAVPATATQFPKLFTWKIGERDRFVPTPVAAAPAAAPPTPAVATSQTPDDPDPLARLRARVGVAAEATAKAAPARGAALEGVVRDSAGRPVAGVTVVTQGPRGEQAEITDGSGHYRIGELAPGRYNVRFYYAEVAVERPNVDVTADKVSQLSIAMQTQSAGAETLTITEKTPTVDIGSTKTGTTVARDFGVVLGGATSVENGYQADGANISAVVQAFGLRPPPAFERPASLAGGWDLVFAAAGKDTVRSGRGARRIPLFFATWPVRVERKLFPALGRDAFLVAELRNPGRQALPGGRASLFVGADPAGEAQLAMMVPGEAITLPLGLDRALLPVRNVQLVESEEGIFSKDEINQYQVSIELSSVHPAALPVRIVDQIPVCDQKDVEVRLVRTEPAAALDPRSGSLEWRLEVPPSGKTRVSFTYSIKRPKGWRLHQ